MTFPAWLTTALEELPAPTNGHDWFWLVGILIITIPSVVAAVLAWQAKRNSGEASTQAGDASQKAGEASQKAGEAKEQLSNGHPGLFRKDFDHVVRKLDQLHDDLVTERAKREEGDDGLREQIDRRFDALEKRLRK